MLRLIKRHVAACAKSSETDWKCSPKDRGKKIAGCPFYIVGPHPLRPGERVKINTKTASEQTARLILRDTENDLFNPQAPPEPEAPKVTIAECVEHWLNTKNALSADRQRRLLQQITEMQSALKADIITDVRKTDLEQFIFSWEGTESFRRTKRENLKGFWKYCYDSDFIPKNIAASLPKIGDKREGKERRVPVLSPEEIAAIFDALDRCDSIYKREGDEVAKQVRAFTLVQRYTGMAIGDVAKLRRDEVQGNEIVCNRKKTGERVWTVIPSIAVDALAEMKPDSSDYFFWSGKGKIHTRTSKWGIRLQKLYVLANVRVREVVKTRRSGGKLKEEPETIKVSDVTPHFWRHTFVRDHYLLGTQLEDIAELIGDEPHTVRKYYSCFDVLRQRKLVKQQEAFFAADPLAERLRRRSLPNSVAV